MYNNIKTRHRGLPGARFSANNRSRGTRRNRSGINPDLFVNQAVELPEAEAYHNKHTFVDFGLRDDILARVTARGFSTPTPIQDQAIPVALSGADVIGIADTGTGKTAAFILPLLQKILNDRRQKVLIIAPTRELAVQIDDELREFARGLNIFSAICIGGAGFGSQVKSLQRRPNFIIGTPGRLKDHLQRRTLYLGDVQSLVLDEADRMVEMGFIDDVRFLISKLPTQRQSLFFSATIMPEVRNLINSFMQTPQTISVRNRDTSLNVEQDVVRFTDPVNKLSLLHDLLAKDDAKKVLIFGRTKHGVEKLSDALQERGFSAVSIHGNKNQSQRQRALKEFKDDHAQIMVATDVAARGLDIPDVTHVINYDAPEQYADYIHRIGRTGRANKKGKAYTFVQ